MPQLSFQIQINSEDYSHYMSLLKTYKLQSKGLDLVSVGEDLPRQTTLALQIAKPRKPWTY